MTLHTSYFGNISKIVQEDQEPPVFVSIAGKTPSWFDGPRMPELAPKKEWWTEWHERFKDSLESSESVTWYTKKYKETVLSHLDQVSVVTKLGELGENIVLLCYETPEKFCHRHLVSEWIDSAYLKHGRESCEWMNSELVDPKCIDTLLMSVGLALVESELSVMRGRQGASKRFTITFADPKRSCSSMLAALIGQTPHQLFDEMHLRDVFKIYDNDRIASLVANPFVGMSYDEMLLRASVIDPEIAEQK